ASPRTSPAWCCSSPRTKAASSPAPACASMAAWARFSRCAIVTLSVNTLGLTSGLAGWTGGTRMNDTGLETLIIPRASDIGGFRVQRALPSARRRMVGPFVFFDQMGPEILAPGRGLDVAPHPHIGLATVTYLFEGEILHRDSLGSVQRISPGDVNWMTAGSGIVHSERTPPDLRASGGPIFGVQTWVALPERFEETAPAFNHHAGNELPVIEDGNI